MIRERARCCHSAAGAGGPTRHVEFYDRYLPRVFARDPEIESGWCPQWRDHPAAESGVDALWRAFEALQQDPGGGLASWWSNLAIPIMRELAIPIMRELLDERGTFAGCSATRHTPTSRPLP